MYISLSLSFTLTLTFLARISSLRQQVCLTLDPTSQCDPPPSVGPLRVQSGNFQSWKQTRILHVRMKHGDQTEESRWHSNYEKS